MICKIHLYIGSGCGLDMIFSATFNTISYLYWVLPMTVFFCHLDTDRMVMFSVLSAIAIDYGFVIGIVCPSGSACPAENCFSEPAL